MADRIIPLTAGPSATLGPEFAVNIARPRNRKALNHDPEFRRLRHDITAFLMGERKRKNSAQKPVEVTLPNLQPADLSNRNLFSLAKA